MANRSDGGRGEKQVPPKVLKQSVVETMPTPAEGAAPASPIEASLLWLVAHAADEITPWGTSPKIRDRQLRAFYPQESYFLSALGTVAARNAAFSWSLKGEHPRVVEHIQDVLDNANMGEGWQDFVSKVSIDLYTQDSGAFVEVVRDGKGPDSSVIGLNHLDAGRCWHTGNPEYPVIYEDRNKVYHRLAWHEALTLSELPAPNERLPGIQLCALTRLLRAAQVIRNITLYKEEKTGGRLTRAMHIIKGVTDDQINDALNRMQSYADAQGFLRYVQPLVVAARDPESSLDLKSLELASLPDGFDEEKTFKQYIAIIAMAFLSDYQDFAPLPGGNLGTSAQSEILHLKTRGKGPALFKKLIAHALNFKVLPRAVTFEFEEQDLAAEEDEARVRKLRAETRKVQIESMELTPEAARQVALDQGDLTQEVFDSLGGADVTPEVTAPDESRVPQQEKEAAPAKAGPFRRRVGGGLPEAEDEGEEGAVAYW